MLAIATPGIICGVGRVSGALVLLERVCSVSSSPASLLVRGGPKPAAQTASNRIKPHHSCLLRPSQPVGIGYFARSSINARFLLPKSDLKRRIVFCETSDDGLVFILYCETARSHRIPNDVGVQHLRQQIDTVSLQAAVRACQAQGLMREYVEIQCIHGARS